MLTMAEYKATCKDCLHFDVCCEDWAYETEGKFTADNFKVWNADKVPCTNHFKNKADVVEVRHGEWEKDPIAIRDDGEIYDYRCSVCTAKAHKGEYGNYDYITDYCPNCGAKMDGKGEGE